MTETEKKRIVLIDDDEEILATVKEMLQRGGYEVVTYDRSFNASNLVAKSRPDLVLLDVNMPFLSGDRLLEVFKRDVELRKIPVVLFSANDENSLRELARSCGAAGYIPKSDVGHDLVGKVRRQLERAERTAHPGV